MEDRVVEIKIEVEEKVEVAVKVEVEVKIEIEVEIRHMSEQLYIQNIDETLNIGTRLVTQREFTTRHASINNIAYPLRVAPFQRIINSATIAQNSPQELIF